MEEALFLFLGGCGVANVGLLVSINFRLGGLVQTTMDHARRLKRLEGFNGRPL